MESDRNAIPFPDAVLILVLIWPRSSVAAALCRHQDGVAHAAALQSEDSGVSAAAYGEEIAGKAASRMGTPADAGSASSPSDLLPTSGLQVPFRVRERVERSPADSPVLIGAPVRPLLDPPFSLSFEVPEHVPAAKSTRAAPPSAALPISAISFRGIQCSAQPFWQRVTPCFPRRIRRKRARHPPA